MLIRTSASVSIFLFSLFTCRWSEAGSEPGRWCIPTVLLWPQSEQPIPDQRPHPDARNGGTFCLHNWHDAYVANLFMNILNSHSTLLCPVFTLISCPLSPFFIIFLSYTLTYFPQLSLPVSLYLSFSICHLWTSDMHLSLTPSLLCSVSVSICLCLYLYLCKDRGWCCSSLVSRGAEENQTAPGTRGGFSSS